MAGTTIHTVEDAALLTQVRQQAADAAAQLAQAAHLHKGQLVVIGCSTSEVVGHNVGSWSTPEVAQAIFDGFHSVFAPLGVYMAAQCCEHLNRAIIMEAACAKQYGLPRVNVVPQKKAGGSFATAAYANFEKPVAIEEMHIARAGLDIGDTFIGMHMDKVCVPVRLSMKQIGEAHLTACRVRPKFIGGNRAVYDESLK